MHTESRFTQLAKTIDTIEAEVKIPLSFRANESIYISVASIAKTLGVSKTDILNNVLDIALTDFIEELCATRPDLGSVDPADGQVHFDLANPELIRSTRKQFGKAANFEIYLGED